jgi:plasmid segregation protein ParM
MSGQRNNSLTKDSRVAATAMGNRNMAEKSEKTALVAGDDGYAQIKLYGDAPARPDVHSFVMKSAIAVGRRGLGNIDGSESIDAWKTEEGSDFSVSDKIETEGTQVDSFHFSEMNRVLIHQALYRAGYGGRKISLLAGLPVANYFDQGRRNDDAIKRKSDNLMRTATLTSSADPTAEVVDVRIGCQAVAAYVDWMLDDELNEVHDIESRIAIVDIGGRTTDIATVIGGNQIDHDRSGTANLGVLDVYRAVERQIQSRFKLGDKFPLTYLDAAVRERKGKLFGKVEDFSDIVETALTEQAAKIKLECERKLQQAATLDAVVFVGGGSALFADLPSLFRNGMLTPDPEKSNARGMYKFFRWKDRLAQAAE